MSANISALHHRITTDASGSAHLEQYARRGARARHALAALQESARAQPGNTPTPSAAREATPTQTSASTPGTTAPDPVEKPSQHPARLINYRLREPLSHKDLEKAVSAANGFDSQVEVSSFARIRAQTLPPKQEAPASVQRVQSEAADPNRFRLREKTSVNEVAFSFEVVTQDGDRVTVNLDVKDTRVATRLYAETEDGERFKVKSLQRSLERAVNIKIEGSLDESELSAIDRLSSQVVDLASDFLQGNGRASLEKAAELDIDSSELSSFVLNLAQRSSTQVRVKNFASEQPAERLAKLDHKFAADLGGFAEALKKLIEQPTEGVDTGTKAQLAQGLLPPLLRTQPEPTAGTA